MRTIIRPKQVNPTVTVFKVRFLTFYPVQINLMLAVVQMYCTYQIIFLLCRFDFVFQKNEIEEFTIGMSAIMHYAEQFPTTIPVVTDTQVDAWMQGTILVYHGSYMLSH